MDEQNWYSPLNHEESGNTSGGGSPSADTKCEKKRKTKKIRVWAIIGLAVLLIVGTSLAFRKTSASISVNGNTFSFGPESKADEENDKGVAEGTDDDFGFHYYVTPDEDEDAEMPDDFKDFFSNYYTSTEGDNEDVDIPETVYGGKAVIEATDPENEILTLQELYVRCVPSVVAITGYVDGETGYYWGTGVILSSDGLVLTNAHVIEGCDSAVVTLSDDSEYEAKLIGSDSISDIAVLKIEAEGLTPAQIGSSADLCVGDEVAAIGNPLGETFRLTLTNGIVSAIDRGISYNGRSMTLIQTNTALNSGNSGGALYDMYGRVIGITNMKMMSSYSSIEGIGFAIPSDTMIKIVNALLADGEVEGRPAIGITVGSIPIAAREQYDLPSGLYISAVSEGSDAEAKGLQAGDIILEVNGTAVTTTSEVSAMKDQLEVGDSMNFKIWRDGETFNVDVVLVDTNDVYG